MSDTPKLAAVKTIYDSNRRSIPDALRLVASQIEDGEFGEVTQSGLVLVGDDGLEIFAIGDTTPSDAHRIFHGAMLELATEIL